MSKAIHYTEHHNTVPEQAINIPIEDVFDKTTVLSALSEACHFPSYFSHNWDSAWDCLTDGDITQLQLCLSDVEQVNAEDLKIFKSLIEDAYKDFGKPQLWIVVSSKNS